MFKKVHNLNFTLLADEDGSVAKKFGVPLRDGGTIKMEVEGKEVSLTRGVTPSRWTFVIDEQGVVRHIDREVKASRHGADLVDTLKGLFPSRAAPQP